MRSRLEVPTLSCPLTRCPFCGNHDLNADVEGCFHCKTVGDIIMARRLEWPERSVIDLIAERNRLRPPPKVVPTGLLRAARVDYLDPRDQGDERA